MDWDRLRPKCTGLGDHVWSQPGGPYKPATCTICGVEAKMESNVWYYLSHTATVSVTPAVSSTQQENKMFQVTTFNFASGAVTNLTFKTQEEAQGNLEMQAAAMRSNLQVKFFFTLSLLDTKTGRYLGFVSDLPPAVTLSGASLTS